MAKKRSKMKAKVEAPEVVEAVAPEPVEPEPEEARGKQVRRAHALMQRVHQKRRRAAGIA